MMKNQTRHGYILVKKSENTFLSAGDNKNVSCLVLHSSFDKLITDNGTERIAIATVEGFCHFWQ